MTKENDKIDFASPEAGELWAEIKAEFGEKVSIDDVKGTGKDGAITKGNVEAYFDGLTVDNEGSDAIDGDDTPSDDVNAPQDNTEGDVSDVDASTAVDVDAQAKLDAEAKAQADADQKAKDDAQAKIDADASNEGNGADTDTNGNTPQADTDSSDDESEDEVEPIEGDYVLNLTDNKFVVEGVEIAPKGKVEMTDALAQSKRVAHGIEVGTLEVK